MDLLLKDLMSTETMGKLAAVEKTASKLANRSWLKDVPNDTKIKLMNASISTVKDANPKIVIGGLNCLDLLIKNYKDDFSPMIAMSFDLLLAKLGDAKAAIREQALEVTLNLIGIMGLVAAFSAISSNINHKNQRVKESLLSIISRLQVLHGAELRGVVSATSMCKTIAPLLNDSVGALRQLAITTLAELYPIYGEDIVDALSGIEMRPAQQKLLLQAIFVQQQKALTQPQTQTQQFNAHPSTADELDPWSLLNDEDDFSHPTKVDKTGLSPTAVPREQREGFNNTHGGLGDAGVSTSKPPVRRSLSATQRRPAPSQPLPSALSSIDSHQFGSTVGARSTASSASFDTLPSGSDNAGKTPTSCYDPSGFMGFIHLKQGTKPTEIVDDKDLQKLTSKIAADLGKKTDWEARTNALVALQKLAWGNLKDFKNCVEIIKGMNDLISTQIIDLRSTLSKEACKAVAALAYSFRQQFSVLAELWWMQLVRVVVVKIQVISSSADRCIRVVVACCQDQRLLNLIMEACGNKNPPLRKLSLEYLALACASWRADIIEKNINAIKQVVRVAVADADSGARKTARQLYWVLHNTPALQSHMKGVFADLEAPIQRHISTEATTDSPEMSDLFLIVQNPTSLLDYARKAGSGGSKGEGCEENKECAAPLKVQPDVKPARAASAKPAARAQAAHSSVRSSNDTMGSQTSEQDSSLRDEMSNISAGVASTTMKSSRRLSLTAGPVRLTQPVSAPAPTAHRESEDAGIAMKTPSATMTAMGSRRLSLQSHMMPPPGRSLARSTDFSSASANDDSQSSDSSQVASGATTISVSSLLSIPHSHNGSSMLSQGAVRNLDAKTPAVKSAAGGASTRPSLFSTHMPPAIEEESQLEERELPSTSTSVAVSAESLRLGSFVDDFAGHAAASTPAVPSSAYVNRRASLGSAFPMTGAAGSTTGTLNSGVSSLMNGPKRIIRAAPAPEPVATQETEERPVSAAARVSHHTVPATPAPSTTQRPSALLSNQVGAHVAAAAESTVKAAAAEAEDRKKPASHNEGHVENGVFVFSGETLRTMVEDTQWSTRVKAFESINMRLQRAISSSEALNEGMIETFVDLCLPHLADPHHKVAADALQVLQTCISSYPQFIKSRMGAILLALFHRLADRRPAIRDQANSILNLMRSTLDSVQIMAALSPRMGEVPDRMKTALMQFMGAIAPHCDEFFLQAANTWAFLSRMAHIISGSGGTKPSVTLTVAARRLLELVFKTSPVMMCSQIAALPFQQQIALKKFLEASVPDIDFQVMQASKTEWTGKAHTTVAPKASTASAAEDLLNTLSMSTEVDFHASLPLPPSCAVVQSADYSADSWDQVESSFDNTAHSSVFELHTRAGQVSNTRIEDEDSVLTGTVSAVSLEGAVPSCAAAVNQPSYPVVAATKTAATELISKVSAVFSPPPPAPASAPGAMSFTPRNLSAAAIDAEVRTLEYLDACQHSRSPSENVSPNSPEFKKKPPAAVADSKVSSFAVLDSPALTAVLASKTAIDIATEEIIQRYSPTKTPSPVLASTMSLVESILDPASDYLHAALYNAYSDSKAASVKTPTSTRPSQLPQRKSPPSNNSHSAEGGLADTQHGEPVHASPENTNVRKSVAHAALPHTATPVKSTPQKKAATPVVTTPPSVKPSHTPSPNQHTSTASASKAPPASTSKATPAPKLVAKSPASTPAAVPPAPVKKDTFWLLESLKPSAVLAVREEASRELKLRIKSADDSYWLQNYAQIVTVLLESFRPDVKEAGTKRAGPLAGFEHMECSTKSLLLLMRYRGPHMKNLLEVLVDKLCRSASFAPAPISQTLEGVLSELGRYDAPRLVKALLPYVTFASDATPSAAASGAVSVDVGAAGSVGECPQVRLMALHVLCNAVRFLTSAQLLSELPSAVPAVLSSVNSSLADLRKAVVFILVEMYLTVGDSVFPYVYSLTPPQRKLLTIYIEKRMNERKNLVAAAQQS